MIRYALATVILLAVSAGHADAQAIKGAEAYFDGCLYFPSQYGGEITVVFSVTAEDNMDAVGGGGTLTTSEAGVQCASLGRFESRKNKKGTWILSYKGQGSAAGLTGSGRIEMEAQPVQDNTATLLSSSPRAEICKTDAPCDSTTQDWPTKTSTTLYVIFYFDEAQDSSE